MTSSPLPILSRARALTVTPLAAARMVFAAPSSMMASTLWRRRSGGPGQTAAAPTVTTAGRRLRLPNHDRADFPRFAGDFPF